MLFQTIRLRLITWHQKTFLATRRQGPRNLLQHWRQCLLLMTACQSLGTVYTDRSTCCSLPHSESINLLTTVFTQPFSSDFRLLSSTVWVKKFPPPPIFCDIFPKRLGIFSQNFTCLLNVPIYAGVQIFIQLPATLTKLCHNHMPYAISATTIMCSKCPPSTETHAGWSHLIWHNFITVGDNGIKICIQA